MFFKIVSQSLQMSVREKILESRVNHSKPCHMSDLLCWRSWNSACACWEPWASGGTVGTPLDTTNNRKYKFFEVSRKATFRCFGALHGSSGAILARLGPIWDPKGTPKWSKSIPKIVQRSTPTMVPKRSPKRPQNGFQNRLAPANFSGVLVGTLLCSWPRMAQNGAQMDQEGTKMIPDRPKTARKWPKVNPR